MTKNSFLKNLINFGIYLGHKQIKSNTTMSIYIYGVYKNIHLINLEKTLIKLYNALALIKLVKEEKNPVLFVSSDPDRYVKILIKSLAKHTNQAYIVNKWIPGLLTNWKQTKLSISQFKLLKNSLLSKSNTIIKNKYNKLKISLEGLIKLNKLPSLIISFSPNQDQLALKEAKIKNIPVIAITDTNAKPLSIDYPIPGNDDSKKALILYINLFERAFNEKSLK